MEVISLWRKHQWLFKNKKLHKCYCDLSIVGLVYQTLSGEGDTSADRRVSSIVGCLTGVSSFLRAVHTGQDISSWRLSSDEIVVFEPLDGDSWLCGSTSESHITATGNYCHTHCQGWAQCRCWRRNCGEDKICRGKDIEKLVLELSIALAGEMCTLLSS